MTTYYVRTDGSNSNAGTSSGTGGAWQTIGKALGASGIASGDTVYIAPGTYRETVTVAMTSATAETKVIGDVSASQFSDLQGGVVRWTGYTTNDTTAPNASSMLTISSKDYLTFEDLWMQGSGNALQLSITTSENLTFRRCQIECADRSATTIAITAAVDTAANILFDSCILRSLSTVADITLPTSASADYDAEIKFQNCTLDKGIIVRSSGANSFKGGGVKAHNITNVAGGGTFFTTSGTNLATSTGNQCEVYNSVIAVITGLSAGASGAIIEDYNLIYAGTTHTNVTPGSNTVYATGDMTHALMLEQGQSALWGFNPRPYLEPAAGSPQLGRGSDASVTLTTDLLGRPRPSGGMSASKAWGALERGSTFGKETGTVRTGSNAISITGPGTHDFQVPADAASTTVTCYVRWDATYAGTKPQMIVLNGEEAGVATATATATGSSGAWEQLSLNFTPTRAGIVTIRLQSNDTNGGGKMFADDFDIT